MQRREQYRQRAAPENSAMELPQNRTKGQSDQSQQQGKGLVLQCGGAHTADAVEGRVVEQCADATL
jgi:hypothetical protein